jgi:hypothetical protein
MTEPAALAAARHHLATAESGFRTPEGLAHLEEGLTLLEQVALDGEHRSVAGNLLTTYSARICDSVRQRFEADAGLPEPELQHLFRLLLAFDSVELELPAYVRTLKIDIARRLIDRWYEGHTPEEKQEALELLAGIAGA